ncbi:MAG: methyltransferase domain-containing protein [Bdellovibrionales bacterium]
MNEEICRLCGCRATSAFQGQRFRRCEKCDFVFKPSSTWLVAEEESNRYRLHNNSIEDQGYVNFLQPVVEAAGDRVQVGALGLDFGCGPTTVLADLLRRRGFEMRVYDPYFFPRLVMGQKVFDFVTCTEACEHFFHPGETFKKLFSSAKDLAPVFVMTSIREPEQILENWYYTKDPTHVGFFSEKCLAHIATTHNRKIQILSPRLAVFF